MNYSTILNTAHQYDTSQYTFEKLHQLLYTVLSFGFSNRYNSKYGLPDMINALIALCIGNSYAESGLKRLAVESDMKHTPSGSWLINSIKKIPEQSMMLQLSNAIDSTIKDMKGIGMFSKPITVAIDKHLIPRYDKNPDEFLIKSRAKSSTTHFESYCTMSSVEEKCRACLGAYHVTPNESNSTFVRKLTHDVIRNDILIRLVLLDREFFSVSVIHELKQLGQKFLMPARKTKGIKNAIVQYVEGNREMISKYKIKSASGHVESFTLVIIPNPKPDKPDLTDQYIVFATNITRGKIFPKLSQIPEEYKRRWGIETGYACIEKLRPRTTSPNHSVRLLMFYFPLIFYNTWIITNCVQRDESKYNGKPIIPIELLKCFFRLFVIQMIRNEKQNYFLEYVG